MIIVTTEAGWWAVATSREKGGGWMTAFEALSLTVQFGLVLIGLITLMVSIVVYLNKKK